MSNTSLVLTVLEEIRRRRIPCYFISPHLDDAVFSAGGILADLASSTSTTMITVCTEGQGPLTVSGKQFLRLAGQTDIQTFFQRRQNEDREAANVLHTEIRHLGGIDALCRTKPTANMLRWLPECTHIYPTYRWHITTGHVSTADQPFIDWLEQQLRTAIPDSGPAVVFAPLAIGRHVDHVIVRDVCQKLFTTVIYWHDAPYRYEHPIDQVFLDKHQLIQTSRAVTPVKATAVQQYHTQWQAVRKDQTWLTDDEVFALPVNFIDTIRAEASVYRPTSNHHLPA